MFVGGEARDRFAWARCSEAKAAGTGPGLGVWLGMVMRTGTSLQTTADFLPRKSSGPRCATVCDVRGRCDGSERR